MDKEIYDKLKEYEKVFNMAINSNFIHLSAGDFDKILSAADRQVAPRQKACNTCRLKILKEIGSDFLRARKEFEEAENKPHRGRPKKINLNGEE